jgi:hypothetical protein
MQHLLDQCSNEHPLSKLLTPAVCLLQRHFWMAFVFPCIAAFFMFAAVVAYARWRRLLWIPETV